MQASLHLETAAIIMRNSQSLFLIVYGIRESKAYHRTCLHQFALIRKTKIVRIDELKYIDKL